MITRKMFNGLLFFSGLQVGMQNSSLGVVLAAAHFSSPLVALPPALSAVIMNVMGSTLGLVWQYITPSDLENETTGMHNACVVLKPCHLLLFFIVPSFCFVDTVDNSGNLLHW